MISIINILLWTSYVLSLYFVVFWFLVFLDEGVSEDKKRLTRFPLVTIAIPAYNREKSVEATIRSALELNYPKEKLEIIAVDHGSSDGTGKIIDRYKDKIRVVHIKRNSKERKGTPMNAALKLASGEFFVCFDADSVVERDALLKMLPHFSDRSVGCVLPSMKVKDPKTFWQKAQWTEYIVNMFYKKIMARLNSVHVAPGPFSVYRTSALRKIGGYDPYNLTEDMEVTYNLQKHNYKILQLLDTEVYTIPPKNFTEVYEQRNRWFKGAFLNTVKYRSMMFNRAYGDFGMMQLPTVMISGILSLTLLFTTLYYALKPRIDFLMNMRFVGFDFWTLIKNFSINISVFDLNYALLLSGIIMLVLSIFVLILSHRYTNEKVVKYGWLPLLFFFVYYYLVTGVAWVGVYFDILRRRHQQW